MRNLLLLSTNDQFFILESLPPDILKTLFQINIFKIVSDFKGLYA